MMYIIASFSFSLKCHGSAALNSKFNFFSVLCPMNWPLTFVRRMVYWVSRPCFLPLVLCTPRIVAYIFSFFFSIGFFISRLLPRLLPFEIILGIYFSKNIIVRHSVCSTCKKDILMQACLIFSFLCAAASKSNFWKNP